MADTKKNTTGREKSFFKGLRGEWDKIVWTDRKTLLKQVIAVVVISVIVCVLITLADSLGLQIMEWVMR